MSDLESTIKKAIQLSGYPFEQRAGNLLVKNKWSVFHSINYFDRNAGIERELDILAYKIINGRRIELRISCKRSTSKPWIFFTEDSDRYFQMANTLKRTPVIETTGSEILSVLGDLRFFSHRRRAINFTALSGTKLDNEARAIVRDGIYSSLSSIYHRVFPHSLLFDERGTIFFFVTLVDGKMFESYFDSAINDDVLTEIEYAQYQTRFPLAYHKDDQVKTAKGDFVSLRDVVYWFSDWFTVEIVRWSLFEIYLVEIETKFSSIGPQEIEYFGKSWANVNFPNIIDEPPKL